MGDTENKTMEAWMKKHTRMIMKVMNLMMKMKIQISNVTYPDQPWAPFF